MDELAGHLEDVHRFRELGFTFFALMSEAALLRAAAVQKLAESH
jgi:2-keto-3-deoxy-L-rhamnonate aldolase RhmA